MTRNRIVRLAVLAVTLCCLAPLAASAQDVVTVGTVTASGSTVDVPVYIRDTAGTPLGVDQPPGSKIQAYSIRVNYSPAAAVSNVTFTRAGITAGLSPSFESSPPAPGSISLLDSFPESTSLIPFTSNAALPGDQVAHLVFTLSASATPGTQIVLALDGSVTQLTNQAGTVKETSGSGLSLTSGAINLPPLTVSLSPSSISINQGNSATVTANLSTSTGSATTITLSSSNTAIATVPPSVSVPAGSTSASFTVTGAGIGSATITATLPNSASATAGVTVGGPGLTLTPLSQTVTVGGTGTLTAGISVTQSSATTVTLSSGDPSVVTVPATVVIPAGASSASFTVNGIAIGSVSVTAQLPPSLGGKGAQALVRVSSDCVTPAAPQISGPTDSPSGTPYTITWPAVSGATEYLVDEATDPGFGNATTKTVTTTSVTFTHSGSSDVRYYYRVRAHNHGGNCDLTSPSSDAISVLVHAAVVPPVRVVPVVGSTAGSFGSFFKTGVQLYNPKSSTISGKIIYHPQGASGTASDPSTTYSLAPGKTQAFADLLPTFSQSGLGTLDVIADLGSSFPITVTRVFNDAGAAGTSGMTEELLPVDQALQAGDSGALIAPPDFTKFRLNIGIRTLDQGVSMTVTVKDKDNVVLKSVDRSYGPTFFIQIGSAAFLDGLALAGNETLSFHINSGSVFIYGATTDNTTNDPSLQLARKIE